MSAAGVLIEARDIHLSHRGREVLRDVDLKVEQGRILTLIGPNGAGKSSLVRVALGLIVATRGTVRHHPGLRIGYMPQRLHVPTHMPLTVRRFLSLGGAPKQSRLRAAAERTRTPHLLDQPMQSLSGGEHQRVLLCRALLRGPELLVLDEPVQGVDVTGQAALYALIADLRDELGCGVLMVSHDLHLVMARTDEVLCLNTHVCCSGHPEQVGRDPAFLELFGGAVKSALAVYTHHHDHVHDGLHGRERPREGGA